RSAAGNAAPAHKPQCNRRAGSRGIIPECLEKPMGGTMTRNFIFRSLTASCVVALITCGAVAQEAKPFEPVVGQQGKDVVWVPTAQALVDRMLDMAKVTPNDILFDLGSGDGRTVITAAKRGAKATGIEFNPDMVALSRRNAATA